MFKHIYYIAQSYHRTFTSKTHTKHTHTHTYEGWNFNSGNYLFTTDTK